jgi:hypothetical protein
MVDPVLQVAERRFSLEEAFQVLAGFARSERGTILYYDLGGSARVEPSDGVSLADVGRMTLMNPWMWGSQAAALLNLGSSLPWGSVPRAARLEDADPSVRGGLWDRALRLYRRIDDLDGFGAAKTSKLLHIKRPHFYPVLDRYVMGEYQRAWQLGEPAPVWEAIRDDLIQNKQPLEEVRGRLAQFDDLEVVTRLSDVRLLDIIAWSIGRYGLAHALARYGSPNPVKQ